jgi:hypothetical protein
MSYTTLWAFTVYCRDRFTIFNRSSVNARVTGLRIKMGKLLKQVSDFIYVGDTIPEPKKCAIIKLQ